MMGNKRQRIESQQSVPETGGSKTQRKEVSRGKEHSLPPPGFVVFVNPHCVG